MVTIHDTVTKGREKEATPRLSIGLPVFNGERYLRHAIDSILNQTYRDFELIISDNASTDQTMEICLKYQAQDPRIRYYRNPENLGASENFNKVFACSRGEYFKWAAADDVIAPTFLATCIEVLDRVPSVVLCYSKVYRIDASGDVTGVYDFPMKVDANEAHIRFTDLIMVDHQCWAVFGVIRKNILAQTQLIAKFVGSDRVLLAEMSLRGPFCECPEYLFYRRDHPECSTRKYDIYNILAWYDPMQKNYPTLFSWRIWGGYLSSIIRINMLFRERLLCFRAFLYWGIKNYYSLLGDIRITIIQIFPSTKGLLMFMSQQK
jgi:glycosyltransferase involved in cell wall biosynthesis